MSLISNLTSGVFNNCRQAVASLRVEAVSERKKRLVLLRTWIHKNRGEIQRAMFDDFRKPPLEVDATEIFHVLNEIKVALDGLDRWTAAKKIDAPWFMLGTRSSVQYEPKGVCLIIAPWNYPFNLAVGPLVSALAAGNDSVVKPSEMTPHVSALIKKMSVDIFDPAIVSVVEGGPEISQTLLALPFDHVFFTGSTAIGKIVMKAAAEHLASVTLELGGKSPALVCHSARLKDAAERIAVGKFLNNGQTCIAPDYLLVEEKVARKFVSLLVNSTKLLFSDNGNFQTSKSYSRIVNLNHFKRLQSLKEEAVSLGARIELGGQSDENSLFMPPVILTNIPQTCRLMQDEIFGPILPIVTFKNLDDAVALINEKPKPLALYVFSEKSQVRQKILNETSSGSVCVNDCAVQYLHHELPFGGVNKSGMGKSHGYAGFLAFSNEKPVLKQKSGFTSIQAFYPPYTRRSGQLMDWFLKFF